MQPSNYTFFLCFCSIKLEGSSKIAILFKLSLSIPEILESNETSDK